jgi:hypothetical protein
MLGSIVDIVLVIAAIMAINKARYWRNKFKSLYKTALRDQQVLHQRIQDLEVR